MPRGKLSKNDLLTKIYRWKTGVYENTYRSDMTTNMKFGYEEALNDMLEFVKEFSV